MFWYIVNKGGAGFLQLVPGEGLSWGHLPPAPYILRFATEEEAEKYKTDRRVADAQIQPFPKGQLHKDLTNG